MLHPSNQEWPGSAMAKEKDAFRIVGYRTDMSAGLAALRADTTARHGAPCLWDAGERWLWPFTLCALQSRRLIAAAQVRPVAIVQEPGDAPHRLFVSLNAYARWEGDAALYGALFARIEALARAMAAPLPAGHPVRLCASVLGSEGAARAFYEAHGFIPYLSILAMTGSTAIHPAAAVEGLEIQESDLLTDEGQFEDEDAFQLDPLGLPAAQPAREPRRTALLAALRGEPCGRLVLWEQEDQANIEDVFVQPACRGRGVARALVAHGLRLLASRGHGQASLQVLRANTAALGLYQSLGFAVAAEETRLERPL